MKIITWSKKYSVKIESIDNEHKVLIDMINEFYDKVLIKSKKELVSETIAKMKEYAEFHFNTEEKYFIRYNYPDIKNHSREHNEFISKVKDLEKRNNEDKLIMSFEITNFLKDWFRNHILISDMKYSKFLIENGVK